VAPLAGALALIGVGVAGAVAVKAELQARARRAWASRNRELAVAPGELPAAALQRMALGQLDVAIELLRGEVDMPPERAVHETRKALKRLRALMRLLREELGRRRFARENAVLRDAGRRLAGARDAEVMVATLDGLVRRHPKPLSASAGVKRLRAQLEAERERAAASGLTDPAAVGDVVDELRAMRRRVSRWRLSSRGSGSIAKRGLAGRGSGTVQDGLQRLYRQGRRRRRQARRTASTEDLHAWRRRVKDLRYSAEMLSPARLPAKKDAGGRRHARRLRDIARLADRLGETLGEEHDLALLSALAYERRDLFKGDRATRKLLLKLIERRRRRLRRRAMRMGDDLYRHGPRRFVRRIRRARGEDRP